MSSSSDPTFSGKPFDLKAFVKQPHVILRPIGILCSVVVFACIAKKVYTDGQCYYDEDDHACEYGIAIGVIAFVDCLAFLVVDVLYERQTDARVRKYMVMADFIFSVIWSIMWFVGFCYLTDRWREATKLWLFSDDIRDNAQAAIAFSFFSIIVWVALAVFAFLRYRKEFGLSFSSDSEGQSGSLESHQQSHSMGEKSGTP